jgi:hypothetical protein
MRELRTGGVSPESREETNMTFALIAQSLKSISGERACWLIAWYESRWGDGVYLSERAGLTRWKFHARCRKDERTLRRALEERGVVCEEEMQCAG